MAEGLDGSCRTNRLTHPESKMPITGCWPGGLLRSRGSRVGGSKSGDASQTAPLPEHATDPHPCPPPAHPFVYVCIVSQAIAVKNAELMTPASLIGLCVCAVALVLMPESKAWLKDAEVHKN